MVGFMNNCKQELNIYAGDINNYISRAEIKISCHLLMAVSERVRTFYSKV